MSRIFLPLVAFFIIFASISNAAEALSYSISNITVSVSDKTPSSARELAFAEARRDAFLILLSRLELPAIAADNITDEEIADMVRSEQINREKIAGNRYSAIFNITFAQDFVNHTLLQKKLRKTKKKQAEKHLIVPVKITGNQTYLWSKNNNWGETIKQIINNKIDPTNNDHPLSQRLILPDADIENISVINRDNISSANYSSFEPLLSRYNANAIYTLFFSYNESSNKVTVDIFYIRKLQKKQFRLKFINANKLTKADILNKIATKTIDHLLSSQKSENRTNSPDLARIKIPLDDLSEWVNIQKKIENSSFINQMIVESISRDEAMILINYIYSESEIIESFARIGFNLKKKSDAHYILSTR